MARFRNYLGNWKANLSGQPQMVIYMRHRKISASTEYNVNLFIINGGRENEKNEFTAF